MTDIAPLLERIAHALERGTPAAPPVDVAAHAAYVWDSATQGLRPASQTQWVPLRLLLHVEAQAHALLENTRRFAKRLPAHHALLWGVRGAGKSALVKAAVQQVQQETDQGLALVEISRTALAQLPQLIAMLATSPRPIVLLCDDWSFHPEDAAYASLKSLLDGGLMGTENIRFYATSNRRQLVAQDALEVEQAGQQLPQESVEEYTALADRFGLWLGFHAFSQEEYLAMVQHYAKIFGLSLPDDVLAAEALVWSRTRGGCSGRMAWHFTVELAGRLGKRIIF